MEFIRIQPPSALPTEHILMVDRSLKSCDLLLFANLTLDRYRFGDGCHVCPGTRSRPVFARIAKRWRHRPLCLHLRNDHASWKYRHDGPMRSPLQRIYRFCSNPIHFLHLIAIAFPAVVAYEWRCLYGIIYRLLGGSGTGGCNSASGQISEHWQKERNSQLWIGRRFRFSRRKAQCSFYLDSVQVRLSQPYRRWTHHPNGW